MAIVEQFWASLSVMDSRRRVSNIRVRVDSTDGQEYLDALDQAARDSTKVGLLFLALLSVTEATLWESGVEKIIVDDTRDAPVSDDVFNFDKFTIGYSAGIDNYVITIPGRVETLAVNPDDPTSILIGDGASPEVTDLISEIEDTVLAKNGYTPTVKYWRINQ